MRSNRRALPFSGPGGAAGIPVASVAPGEVAFPSRAIRIIVPTAPAGAGDLIARQLGDRLAKALRTPVIVENKPGGSGVIATEFVAHAPPDGYTLLLATSATHVIAAQVIANLPYDPVRDFSTVINAGYAMSVIVVSDALRIANLGELIAYARAHPGQLNYASSGAGSANHIDTEVFAELAAIEMVHVPYRGTADGYRALQANQVQVMFGAVTSAIPYLRSGKLRALAVLADRRSPLLPDVPTIAESGLGRVDVLKWLGLMAPAGTPPEIIARLNRALDAILREPDMHAWMVQQGLDAAGGSPEDFSRTLRADVVKWRETMRRLRPRTE